MGPNEMKKMLCLACVLILASGLFACAAAERTHEHSFGASDIVKDEWVKTASAHAQYRYRYYYCPCGEYYKVKIAVLVHSAAHEMSQNRHAHNCSGTHAYEYQCSLCGYCSTNIIACGGPPCLNDRSWPETRGFTSRVDVSATIRHVHFYQILV